MMSTWINGRTAEVMKRAEKHHIWSLSLLIHEQKQRRISSLLSSISSIAILEVKEIISKAIEETRRTSQSEKTIQQIIALYQF